jgi:hypothetical protein
MLSLGGAVRLQSHHVLDAILEQDKEKINTMKREDVEICGCGDGI